MSGDKKHLKKRGKGGWWWYVRAVPTRLRNLEPRWPQVQIALRTNDIFEARQERDRLAKADDIKWKALTAGCPSSGISGQIVA